MSTFSLSQTGTEINSAIGKVHNADTTPTQGSTNMVTSGGVYTAVNNVDVDALPITTSAQGIINQDNDDKVPTNAAVKDLVYTTATREASLRRSGSTEYGRTSSGELRMLDPSSFSSNGVTFSTTDYRTNVTIAQGTYYRLSVSSRVYVTSSDGSPAQTHQIRDGSTVLAQVTDSTNDYSVENRPDYAHYFSVGYSPSSIFYAASQKNYSFNTYWKEGDSAGCSLSYMGVYITVYYQRPIVLV